MLFLAGGAIAHVMSASKVSEFNAVTDAPMPPSLNGKCDRTFDNDGGPRCHELAQAAESRKTLAIVGYAAGGAALAAAVILYVTAPSGAPAAAAGKPEKFVVSCSPLSGVSCALTLRF